MKQKLSRELLRHFIRKTTFLVSVILEDIAYFILEVLSNQDLLTFKQQSTVRGQLQLYHVFSFTFFGHCTMIKESLCLT